MAHADAAGGGVLDAVRRVLDTPERQVLAGATAVEVLLVGFYFLVTPSAVSEFRYVVYPLVWINAGLWAVVRVDPPAAPTRHRLLAGWLAAAYLLVLLYLAGLVGFHTHAYFELGFTQVGLGSPGWGPRVAYVAEGWYAYFVPFRVIGYLCLAYLAYVAVLDTTTAVVSGALGLLSCLSCSFPLLVALAAGVTGGGSALTGAVYAATLDASTVVFVASVLLLVWRPAAGRGDDDGAA